MSIAEHNRRSRHAAELGFAGALLLPPFYYKGVPDEGLIAYVEAVLEATAARSIPVYLYHFPAQSGLAWHVELVKRLLSAFGNRIVGLKDSSGDMAYARSVACVVAALLPGLASGCTTSNTSNAALTTSVSTSASPTLAFESIDGPPVGIFNRLVDNLSSEAQARRSSRGLTLPFR